MVFCDRPYELDDYLTDRTALLAYRKQVSISAAGPANSR
jgi:hypothetical protein